MDIGTIISTFIAAAVGTYFGGNLTKNGFTEGIKHELEETNKRKELEESLKIFPYIDVYYTNLSELFNTRVKIFVPETDYIIPVEIQSRIFTLSYLSWEEKEDLLHFSSIVSNSVFFMKSGDRKTFDLAPNRDELFPYFDKDGNLNIATLRRYVKLGSRLEKEDMEKEVPIRIKQDLDNLELIYEKIRMRCRN